MLAVGTASSDRDAPRRYLYLWLPKVYVFACVPCFLALTDFGAFLFAWVVQRVLLGNNYRERCKRSTELWSLPHLKWWLVAQIQGIVTQRLERIVIRHAAHEYLL